jgi:hypothetical protein
MSVGSSDLSQTRENGSHEGGCVLYTSSASHLDDVQFSLTHISPFPEHDAPVPPLRLRFGRALRQCRCVNVSKTA